ncbi:MAG: bifunctional oligoribonuclease/PAP phosphatase NrnA [Acidobacteria bacterium]|nr:MAG: bifunctional oligoribonuclease/PAP phosphatase NrnA [Acidobacteriota bacterium]
MNTLAEVLNAMRSRQRWVITSHAGPDGDAVGSVLACVHILRAMGKQADGFLSDGVPFIYRGLPGAAEIRVGPVDGSRYDGVVILECDCLERAGLKGIEKLFSVNIDHHDTFLEYADVNYVVSSAAAAAELVYNLAQAAGVVITPDIATCLYTAVLTDTGSFCYSTTSAQTFAFAHDMVQAGADPVTVAQQVYFSNPASKMRLLGRALANLEHEGAISWMHVSEADMRSTGATEQDCEGLANWAIGIEGIEAAAFFREISGSRYRVSLRSKGRVDVARIAEIFGGGGHKCASGLTISGPFELARDRVLIALRHALELSEFKESAGA